MFIICLGTPLHIDPIYTDAFNSLLKGEKWWVVLPKDLYEFSTELSCLDTCSETTDFTNGVKLWYSHIFPQLRYNYKILIACSQNILKHGFTLSEIGFTTDRKLKRLSRNQGKLYICPILLDMPC